MAQGLELFKTRHERNGDWLLKIDYDPASLFEAEVRSAVYTCNLNLKQV